MLPLFLYSTLIIVGFGTSEAFEFQQAWDNTTWSPIGAEPNGTGAIQALVERRLPQGLHHTFNFEISPSLLGDGLDGFAINDTLDGEISITATGTSALSRGVLTFLREHGGDIYWSGDTFKDLANITTTSEGTDNSSGYSWATWRYLFNVVTYSYSMVWYDWDQWEYLLDWASLHGINLPLAIGGHEYIWAAVYSDFGMSEQDILSYFSGPAFLSWERMGNIHGSWGQNITSDWLDKQWELQKQIVARMVALGMTPVLPAFDGFIPEQLHPLIGGPTPIVASQWAGMPVEYTKDQALDASWDSFHLVQEAYLTKQRALYGGWSSGYYSLDLFNELKPFSLEASYLKNLSANVVSSLRKVDPSAIWIMQGWLFVNDPDSWNQSTISDFLSGANEGEMIILDLASEAKPIWDKTDSFYGTQWLWNILMTYGQVDGMYGSVWNYTEAVIVAKNTSKSLLGMGLTMEGINNNEVVFEMMLDTPWQNETIDPDDWVMQYIARRYGLHLSSRANGTQNAEDAWRRLIGLINITGPQPTQLMFSKADILDATTNLLEAGRAAPGLQDSAAYCYDLTECARQLMMVQAQDVYEELISLYNGTSAGNTSFDGCSETLLGILVDTNNLIKGNKNYLLSKWIDDARGWGADEKMSNFYEFEARNQLTIWGPAAPQAELGSLDRYASKQWAGVVDDYYLKNWALFTDYLGATDPGNYNQSTVDAKIRALEIDWVNELWGTSANQTNTIASQNLLDVVSALLAKYFRQ